jgi:hypothetical protein
MKTSIYYIYNLSNPHFQNVEVHTMTNKIMKGQFVQFKVVEEMIEYIYPSEKYCFLPEEKRSIFLNAVNLNNGEFKEFPCYIEQLSLNDIAKISIQPMLVV